MYNLLETLQLAYTQAYSDLLFGLLKISSVKRLFFCSLCEALQCESCSYALYAVRVSTQAVVGR